MVAELMPMQRLRILRPLRRRDFALLTFAGAVSLAGDGFFYVALAWQVYEMSGSASVFSLVGAAWTLPHVLFLVVGGVATDRFEHRRLLISADLLRGSAVAALGLLALGGDQSITLICLLVGIVGVGDAVFNPAWTAIVPTILPPDELPQGNAVEGIARPLMFRMLGPGLGGVVVAAAGTGAAFLIDAGTFFVSAGAIAALRSARAQHGAGHQSESPNDLREGLRFVRANAWCWGTLAAFAVGMLAFQGPFRVLLPLAVKDQLDSGVRSLGIIHAAGGIAAVAVSIVIGQRGLPRRPIIVMLLSWAIGVLSLVAYGVMNQLWQPIVASSISASLFTMGEIIWITTLQQLVPVRMLGRVSSLDWMISTGLVPISFILTGPLSVWLGASRTMVLAGAIGAVGVAWPLLVPSVRNPERSAD